MTSWIKNKFRLVAARASDALGQMADIVAPTLYESNMGEFHHRWQTVARFLDSVMSRDLEPSEQRRLLLDSHTRESLQRLVLLIYSEENTSDRLELSLALQKPSALGDGDAQQLQHAPRECLEYLLEKQIISHLCEFGVRDQPSGIMSLSLQFVGALLSRYGSMLWFMTKLPFLTHVSMAIMQGQLSDLADPRGARVSGGADPGGGKEGSRGPCGPKMPHHPIEYPVEETARRPRAD